MQLNQLKKSIFLKNLSIYMGGGLLSKIISFATFLYLGKLLEPESFAGFALFTTVVGVLSIFSLFGLPSGMMRIIWDDKRVMLTNSLFIVFTLSSIIALFLFYLGNYFLLKFSSIYGFLVDYKFLIYLRIITLSGIMVLSTYYISIEKPAKFVKVSIVSSVINLILVIFAANYQESNQLADILWLVIFAQTVAGFISLIYGLFISAEYILPSLISIKKSIEIMQQTWVFFIKQFIGGLQTYAVTIVLSLVASSYLFGVYSYYAMILIQLSFISGIFFKAYTPKIRNLVLSTEIKLQNHAISLVKKTIRLYIKASILVLLVLGWAMYLIFQYQDNFSAFIQLDYLQNLDLFYLMLFTWFVGNIRSFYDVWQYTQDKRVNKYIIIIQLVILFTVYFGTLIFFKFFSIYGVVLNQNLIYIFYCIFAIFCFKRFVIKRLSK